MNLLVTVLSARSIHVSTHVRANKRVFLGVYDIKKKGTIKENLLQKHSPLNVRVIAKKKALC